MPPNQIFRVAFGPYDLALDRTALTYRLIETQTGTVWAEDLSVGWVEFEDRVTGGLSRYELGQARLFSLSERAGAQGKEILFGLDCLGIPIDVYVTCRETEIQLTVEANRDSKTHRISEFCLLPDLCAAPDDGHSYLVLPRGEGAILLTRDAPAEVGFLPVWDASSGVVMPFFGAVRGQGEQRSALALLTDSAYAALRLERGENGSAALSAHYTRDPERRRLDLRIVLLPGGDHVAIARAYRDKIVGEKQHILLRRKARERPPVDTLMGGALVTFPIQPGARGRQFQSFAEAVEVARDLKNALGMERAACLFDGWSPDDEGLGQAIEEIRALGFLAGVEARHGRDLSEIADRGAPNVLFLEGTAGLPLDEDFSDAPDSRWDDMDRRMERIARAHERFPVFGSDGGCDWSAIACDFWRGVLPDSREQESAGSLRWSARAPLYSVVYHDSVVAFPYHPIQPEFFLRTLLALSPPHYFLDHASYFNAATGLREHVRRTWAVLAPLHRLCFPAFLTAHRFLPPDFTVEEARYSNGARVIANLGDAPFENDEIALPPWGFVAEHPRLLAHDALRYAGETFATRAWRVARSRDEKPLAESADVERREFPV